MVMPSESLTPMIPSIVVMGVSGTGKTTFGSALAAEMVMVFVDGDDLHPPANVAKMSAGIPLEDLDRIPWLEAVGAVLSSGGTVVACSALKRKYRDALRGFAPSVRFVHLRGMPSLIASRASSRIGHFMPPALVQSQLDTLELPEPDENVLELDIAAPVVDLVRMAASGLRNDHGSARQGLNVRG
ncbi:gluconokinase [Microbacterium sp.]|uniref:gluconokinase n=1 Tax=Microbacterium sp. TaxID=51671 RepID=UPI002810A3F2|nr:gluconokinase [Microbacterium sp.]